MKTKHLLIIGLTASSLAMGSSQALAAGFVIDSFDLPSSSPDGTSPPGYPPIIFFNGGQSQTQMFTGLPSNETIGGTRNFEYRLDAEDAGVAPISIGRLVTGTGNFDGYLDISNNNQAASTTELLYQDLNASGMDQLDFSDKGISITQISDGIPFSYTLLISDGMNNSSTVTKSFDFDGNLTTTQATFSANEILAGCGPMGCDDLLNNVNYIKLIVEGNTGYDLSITELATFDIPEPSAILGLLAVLGTGAFSIKRNTKEK